MGGENKRGVEGRGVAPHVIRGGDVVALTLCGVALRPVVLSQNDRLFRF